MSQQPPARTPLGQRHATEMAAGDLRDAVMLGQRFVQERIVRRQELQDAAVLPQDAVQEQLGFTHERGAHTLVEIAEQVHVRFLGFDVAQEQPLGGEVGHQGAAARVGEHARHLAAQDFGLCAAFPRQRHPAARHRECWTRGRTRGVRPARNR